MRQNTHDRSNIDLERDQVSVKKSYWISLAITFVIGLLMAVAGFFIIKSSFQLSFADHKWRLFTDACTFPGVLLIMVFLLVVISNGGAFDAISYSVKLVIVTIFYKNVRESKLPKNYTEYRLLKQSKPRASFTYLLYVGLFFLFLTILFLILYYTQERGIQSI